MPYIVTTKQRRRVNPIHPRGASIPGEASRRAVATLDEARDHAEAVYHKQRGTDADDAEAGIGPDDPIRGEWLDALGYLRSVEFLPITLPDGTVIEVERAHLADLADSVAFPEDIYEGRDYTRQVIAAYNAAQEKVDA